MKEFCESEEFRDLNIGLSLDEGLAREDNDMTVFYGERHAFWVTVSNNGLAPTPTSFHPGRHYRN